MYCDWLRKKSFMAHGLIGTSWGFVGGGGVLVMTLADLSPPKWMANSRWNVKWLFMIGQKMS